MAHLLALATFAMAMLAALRWARAFAGPGRADTLLLTVTLFAAQVIAVSLISGWFHAHGAKALFIGHLVCLSLALMTAPRHLPPRPRSRMPVRWS